MVNAALRDESYKYCEGSQFAFDPAEISLCAPRNGRACFQIAVSCDKPFTLSVGNMSVFGTKAVTCDLRASCGLVSAGGDFCGKVSLRHIAITDDGDGVAKNDVILEDDYVWGEAGEIKWLWAEIEVPRDAEPGVSGGYVDIFAKTMFGDEQRAARLTFSLEIFPYILPELTESKFHLVLWQHLSNIARKHETPLWSDAHFDVLEQYVVSLARLGCKSITVIASDIPWSGQFCMDYPEYPSDLYEYNMAKVTKRADGRFAYDFSVMERYVELCMKHGIYGEIEICGLINIWQNQAMGLGGVAPDYPDALRVRYFDEADGVWRYMRSGDELRAYIRALDSFFHEKGWDEIALCLADEPSDPELYAVRLRELKSSAPHLKCKAAINHIEFIERFDKEILDMIPILPFYFEKWEQIKEIRKTHKGRMMWYVCCAPRRPNTFIASPLLESRLIGILTSFLGLDGFLRWNYAVWTQEPRRKSVYKLPSGDMHFVMPSNGGKPLLTLRYKNLQRGLEDYVMLEAVREARGGAAVSDALGKVIRFADPSEVNINFDGDIGEFFSVDWRDYDALRRALLNILSESN